MIKITWIGYFAWAMMGCGGMAITYDYDKTTDFAKYHTYAFTDNVRLPVHQFERQNVIQAIHNQMQARDYRCESDTIDLLVDILAKPKKRFSTAVHGTSPKNKPYGPWKYGFGSGFTTDKVDMNKFSAGTLFINIIDCRQKKIIWQGRGTDALTRDKGNLDQREANINYAVAMIFRNYPIKLTK